GVSFSSSYSPLYEPVSAIVFRYPRSSCSIAAGVCPLAAVPRKRNNKSEAKLNLDLDIFLIRADRHEVKGVPGNYLVGNKLIVKIRPAVAEELPCVSDLTDLVQVKIGNYQLGLIPRAFGDDLTSGVAEVTLAVKLADVPRSLSP